MRCLSTKVKAPSVHKDPETLINCTVTSSTFTDLIRLVFPYKAPKTLIFSIDKAVAEHTTKLKPIALLNCVAMADVLPSEAPKE